MNTIKATKQQIVAEPKHWRVWLMDFVDDFRYYKDPAMIAESFELTDDQTDALLASTVETLCDELRIDPPAWLRDIEPCIDPYFVAGYESLKASALVQSPVRFRTRKVFVHQDFLSRV